MPVPPLAKGSSPHTRGALPAVECGAPDLGIIPAYAGSTTAAYISLIFQQDHPRIRGEHAALASQAHSIAGSSPHTRGALRQQRLPCPGRGIIPAYAGSTSIGTLWVPKAMDHPRIRGEHFVLPRRHPPDEGSSPHTRGARLEIPAIPRIAAVIIPVFLYPSPTPQEEADRSMVLLTLS